jgi:hypothetical protein
MKKKIKRKVKILNYLQSHGISPTLNQPKKYLYPPPKVEPCIAHDAQDPR